MSEDNFYPEGSEGSGQYQQPETYGSETNAQAYGNPTNPGNSYSQGMYQQNPQMNQGMYQENPQMNQGMYQQNSGYQQYNGYQQPMPKNDETFGILSLVLGILSLTCFCCGLHLISAVLAIIFGIIQLTKPEAKKAMPIAGIITAALSILLSVVLFIAMMVSADFSDAFQDEFEKYYSEYQMPEIDDGEGTF